METNNIVEDIRDKIRQNCQLRRNKQRFDENDSFRLGLEEIESFVDELENITEKDIHGLCVRIKRRKHADSYDLFRLSQGFLQSNENLTMFAKIPGALQIIIKELTGHDSEQQIRAAETLCNLSLGDEIVCEKIATQAGSYLITFLESIDVRLVQSSLWTLINIVSTGGKGLDIVLAMGLFSKCSDIFYSNNNVNDSNFVEDAGICLNLIFKFKTYNQLKSENINTDGFFEQITKISHDNLNAENLIKIIFNSSVIKSDYKLNDEQLEYIAHKIVKDILNVIDFMGLDSVMKISYDVRILSNIIFVCQNRFIDIFEKICLTNNTSLINIINLLFKFQNENLKNEMLWLLKNLISVVNDDIKKNELLYGIKIPSNI